MAIQATGEMFAGGLAQLRYWPNPGLTAVATT